MNPTTKKIISEVSMLILTQVVVFIGFRYLVNKFDPQSDQKKQAQEKSKTLTNKLQLKNITLNEYEKIIMGEVILPDDLKVTFSDIGGLDDIIGELKESVIYPLNHPQLFSSTMDLFGSPKGVLLYGPPGCGKTMLAKALAKESRARFINLHLSTLMDKWFGESNRLVKAVFTLADKLQPTIIFIDEIDSLFRTRESRDHEATSMMKAEFMSLWDGLATDSGNRVLVIGATNRPNDIDAAIMRRMPKRFYLKPPGSEQRKNILKLYLKNAALDSNFDLEELVERTTGMSGSDLKELCREAMMAPICEYMRSNPVFGDNEEGQQQLLNLDEQLSPPESYDLRPVTMQDFTTVLSKEDDSLLNSYNSNFHIASFSDCD